MTDQKRKLPLSLNYSEDLTFRIAPVNKKIMNADMDWMFDEEMCTTPEIGVTMLLPFIEPYIKGSFKFDDEINTMSFAGVKAMISDLSRTAEFLQTQFDAPSLREFKDQLPLSAIAGDVAAAIASSGTPSDRDALLKENLSLIIEFYRNVVRYLTHLINDLKKDGFRHIAITAP